AQYRLPAIYYFRYFASDGGLISYGPDEMDLFVRTASYVDRILKGASASDLPVQQPTRFELVISLKTAKALGLNVSDRLLALANELSEGSGASSSGWGAAGGKQHLARGGCAHRKRKICGGWVCWCPHPRRIRSPTP